MLAGQGCLSTMLAGQKQRWAKHRSRTGMEVGLVWGHHRAGGPTRLGGEVRAGGRGEVSARAGQCPLRHDSPFT